MHSNAAPAAWVNPFASPSADTCPASLDNSTKPAETSFTLGLSTQLAKAAIIAVIAFPWFVAIPQWLEPTIIGNVWGGLLVTGLLCSWSRHRVGACFFAAALAVLAHGSLSEVTDLARNARWAIVATMIGGGWFIGWTMTPCRRDRHPPIEMEDWSRSYRSMSQWAMWDIAGLTTIAAILCWSVPRIEGSWSLLRDLVPAMIGGMIISAGAIDWGFRDRWSLPRLTAMALVLPGLAALCLFTAPQAADYRTLFNWLIAGPATTIAVQGMLTLTLIATLRIDQHLATHATHHQPRVATSSRAS